MAARFVRDEEAAGSNPATPTQVKGRFRSWNRPLLILPGKRILIVLIVIILLKADGSGEGNDDRAGERW